MGYIKHDVVLAAGPHDALVNAATAARRVLRGMGEDGGRVDAVIVGPLEHHDRWVLMMLPDGSKEGAAVSDLADKARGALLQALQRDGVTYTHASFGGDQGRTRTLARSGDDAPAAAVVADSLFDGVLTYSPA